MHSFSYEVGFNYAAWAGAVAAFVSFLIGIVNRYVRYQDERDEETPAQRVIYTFAHAIVYPVLGGLSVAAITYSITNLALQIDPDTGAFWKWFDSELVNGVLGLRAALIIFGAKAFVFLWQRIEEPDWSEITTFPFLPSRFEEEQISNILGGQHAFFLVAVVIIAILTIAGLRNVTLSVASWALFFIADDWAIISEYEFYAKGYVLRSHDRKIWIFNLILLFVIPYSVYFSVPVKMGLIMALLVFLVLALTLYSRVYWERPDGPKSSPTDLVGRIGWVRKRITSSKEGRVIVRYYGNELWTAVLDPAGPYLKLKRGAWIEVVGIDGNRLVVEPLDDVDFGFWGMNQGLEWLENRH